MTTKTQKKNRRNEPVKRTPIIPINKEEAPKEQIQEAIPEPVEHCSQKTLDLATKFLQGADFQSLDMFEQFQFVKLLKTALINLRESEIEKSQAYTQTQFEILEKLISV